MQNKIQISLKACCVANNYAGVGIFAEYKVPRHFLFNRVREERVCAGKIDQNMILSVFSERPAGGGNCFSRPVAGVLIHAGQSVEHRAFADVRIPGEGYHNIAGIRFESGRICVYAMLSR